MVRWSFIGAGKKNLIMGSRPPTFAGNPTEFRNCSTNSNKILYISFWLSYISLSGYNHAYRLNITLLNFIWFFNFTVYTSRANDVIEIKLCTQNILKVRDHTSTCVYVYLNFLIFSAILPCCYEEYLNEICLYCFAVDASFWNWYVGNRTMFFSSAPCIKYKNFRDF